MKRGSFSLGQRNALERKRRRRQNPGEKALTCFRKASLVEFKYIKALNNKKSVAKGTET
jgi:hypothetical protein